MGSSTILASAFCLLWGAACAGDESRWARTPLPAPPPEGQRTLERADPNTGQVLRRWTIRYAPDGRVYKDGPEHLYFADGTPRAVRDWVKGEPTGLWKSFHSNGALHMRVIHASEPSAMVFFDSNGTLIAQGPAVDGVKHGEWVHFYTDGSLSHAGSYERGMKEGPWTHYYPGGSLAKRGLYLDGRVDGVWHRWESMPPTWNDSWWPLESAFERGPQENSH